MFAIEKSCFILTLCNGKQQIEKDGIRRQISWFENSFTNHLSVAYICWPQCARPCDRVENKSCLLLRTYPEGEIRHVKVRQVT